RRAERQVLAARDRRRDGDHAGQSLRRVSIWGRSLRTMAGYGYGAFRAYARLVVEFSACRPSGYPPTAPLSCDSWPISWSTASQTSGWTTGLRMSTTG